MGYGGGVFLPFADATNGSETYGGGRYLLDTIKGADLGSTADGRVILDFNFSYSPSCAYSPRWVCPLPPPANRLDVAVTAGNVRQRPDRYLALRHVVQHIARPVSLQQSVRRRRTVQHIVRKFDIGFTGRAVRRHPAEVEIDAVSPAWRHSWASVDADPYIHWQGGPVRLRRAVRRLRQDRPTPQTHTDQQQALHAHQHHLRRLREAYRLSEARARAQ
jgi:hypothetical protein